MKLKLLTAAAVLAASASTSAGELDGKAISCVIEPHTDHPQWYMFDDGNMVQCYVDTEGTVAVEKCDISAPYETSSTTV